MKLLILTQAVDRKDPVLGFFHAWISEFARHTEQITVICLQKGEYQLPENVSVHSLGKEEKRSRIRYLFRFYTYIWRFRHDYDTVFVHMNPEYAILGGFFWRLQNKRIGLWYVHRARTWIMRLGTIFSHLVFTSAEKSFSVRSKKVHVVGHGIDTKLFSELPLAPVDAITPRLLFVGRVSPIKRIEVCIEALARLREKGVTATLDIYGAPLMRGDAAYLTRLQKQIETLKLVECVTFHGAIANDQLPHIYAAHSALVNASPTGGVDKVVLEAMASGLPVFVSNRSFEKYLGEFAETLITDGSAEDFAAHISGFLPRADMRHVQERMRQLAFEHADISKLIPAIMQLYGASR